MHDENNLNNLPQNEAEPAPPVETPEAASPSTGENQPPEPQVDESPDPTSLKAEIEELEQRRKKAEEDAIYWRKQKAEARADYFRGRDESPRESQQAPPAGVGQEPKPSDYEDYDKYVAAVADYRVRVARAEWERDQSRREQERTAQERHQSLQVKLQEGFERYPDFEEVAFDRTATHITPMIVDILADCDHPADVAYYLAKNRVEGVAISKMTPIQAARAIARLEAKMEASPAQPPPKKTTNAPPPIRPIGASASAGVSKDPDKMTPKEFEQWRLSQGARRY